MSGRLHRLQAPQPEGKGCRHLFRRDVFVILGGLRQKQSRFQIGQPARHDEIFGRQIQPLARSVDESEILLGKLQDRQLCQVDLFLARQCQEQVQRSFIAVDVDNQCLVIGILGGLEWQVFLEIVGHAATRASSRSSLARPLPAS